MFVARSSTTLIFLNWLGGGRLSRAKRRDRTGTEGFTRPVLKTENILEGEMKIKTNFEYPPIPVRRFDWHAIDDDTYDGHGSPIGYGATEAEAIADLMDQLND